MTFKATSEVTAMYLNPSYDWPDHRLLRRIVVWPCGCQTALYADDVTHWTLDRTMWSCELHGMTKDNHANLHKHPRQRRLSHRHP